MEFVIVWMECRWVVIDYVISQGEFKKYAFCDAEWVDYSDSSDDDADEPTSQHAPSSKPQQTNSTFSKPSST